MLTAVAGRGQCRDVTKCQAACGCTEPRHVTAVCQSRQHARQSSVYTNGVSRQHLDCASMSATGLMRDHCGGTWQLRHASEGELRHALAVGSQSASNLSVACLQCCNMKPFDGMHEQCMTNPLAMGLCGCSVLKGAQHSAANAAHKSTLATAASSEHRCTLHNTTITTLSCMAHPQPKSSQD